eukprot:COSAG01_NODE_1359_length_10584_cov_133.767668_10_plen_1029_part_00
MMLAFWTVPLMIKSKYYGFFDGLFGGDEPDQTFLNPFDPPGTFCPNRQVWDSPIGADVAYAQANFDKNIAPAPFAFAAASGIYSQCWRKIPVVKWAQDIALTDVPCQATCDNAKGEYCGPTTETFKYCAGTLLDAATNASLNDQTLRLSSFFDFTKPTASDIYQLSNGTSVTATAGITCNDTLLLFDEKGPKCNGTMVTNSTTNVTQCNDTMVAGQCLHPSGNCQETVHTTTHETWIRVEHGCAAHTNAWWFAYPPKRIVWNLMFCLPVGLAVFGLSPYAIHRIMVSLSEDIVFKMNGLAVATFPIMIMMTGTFLGITVSVVGYTTMNDQNIPLIDTVGSFTAMATIFTDLGGAYKVCSGFFMVSATASFMSTADSVIISLSNMWTEDHFVGWLQKYVPENAFGGRNKQALYAGKVISVSILVSSVSIAVHSEIQWLKILSLGIAVVWCFLIPPFIGMGVESIHSPACIATGIGAFIMMLRYDMTMHPLNGADTCAHGGPNRDAPGWCLGCQAACGPDFTGTNGGPLFGFAIPEADMPKHQDMWSDCGACLESPGYDPNAPIVASTWDATLGKTIFGNHPATRTAYPGVGQPGVSATPPLLDTSVYTAVWVFILLPVFSLIMKVYELATGTKYDDANKPAWMRWDQVDNSFYAFGVRTDRIGHRMLIKGRQAGTWVTAQVTQTLVIGETTVVCKIIDHNKGGAVVETDRIVDISELYGMPFSKGVVDDINRVFRPVYDTPFGLLVWLAVPVLFLWATPLWKISYFDCATPLGHIFGKPEYGYCGDEKGDWAAAVADGATVYEEVVGVGLPEWANRYLFCNFFMSFLQAFSYMVLIRTTDDQGKAIAGTSKDWWAWCWPLDLTWKELFKHGCKKRSKWVLEEASADDLQDWINANPEKAEGLTWDQFKGKDGKELNQSIDLIDESIHTKLREIGMEIYYSSGKFLPPPGTVPVGLNKDGSTKGQKIQVRQLSSDEKAGKADFFAPVSPAPQVLMNVKQQSAPPKSPAKSKDDVMQMAEDMALIPGAAVP